MGGLRGLIVLSHESDAFTLLTFRSEASFVTLVASKKIACAC
jgi:hypothetical protein